MPPQLHPHYHSLLSTFFQRNSHAALARSVVNVENDAKIPQDNSKQPHYNISCHFPLFFIFSKAFFLLHHYREPVMSLPPLVYCFKRDMNTDEFKFFFLFFFFFCIFSEMIVCSRYDDDDDDNSYTSAHV